jgi:translation initiation factor IF-3
MFSKKYLLRGASTMLKQSN